MQLVKTVLSLIVLLVCALITLQLLGICDFTKLVGKRKIEQEYNELSAFLRRQGFSDKEINLIILAKLDNEEPRNSREKAALDALRQKLDECEQS